ncbi:hypothetical protein Tco_0863222, partial [Tanacetum coccineum]
NTSRVEGPDSCKYENGIRINKDRDKGGVELKGAGQYTYDSRETFKINKEFRKKERCIEIEDNEINSEVRNKVVGRYGSFISPPGSVAWFGYQVGGDPPSSVPWFGGHRGSMVIDPQDSVKIF